MDDDALFSNLAFRHLNSSYGRGPRGLTQNSYCFSQICYSIVAHDLQELHADDKGLANLHNSIGAFQSDASKWPRN